MVEEFYNPFEDYGYQPEPEEEVKEKASPFIWLEAISSTREHPMIGTSDDQKAEKAYNAFFTNRGLSYCDDALLVANEMNMRHGLDRRMQFDYLFYSLPAANRRRKWFKGEKDDDVRLVREVFGIRETRARQALLALGEDGVAKLREAMDTGGKR